MQNGTKLPHTIIIMEKESAGTNSYDKAGIDALPPTSSEIRGHIHRGDFLVNRACRLLATDVERDARLELVEH